MSAARHHSSPGSPVPERNWSRPPKRFSGGFRARIAVAAAVAVVGAAAAVAVPVLTASPASADTTTQTFDHAGTYSVTVPQYLTSFSVTGSPTSSAPFATTLPGARRSSQVARTRSSSAST